MKHTKRIIASLFVVTLLLSLLCAPKTKTSMAAGKIVKRSSIKGKHYTLGIIKSIKLKGSKVTIEANYGNSLAVRKKTFKIDNKTKFYHAEEYWYYNGKITKKKFVKLVKSTIKNSFPAIHIWVKNNKIVNLGESA